MTPDLLDGHGRPTPATTFLLVHRALRRDLVLLRAAAAAAAEPDDGQVGWVRERWGVFRRVLTDHHRSEDERLFPALRAAEPGLGPVLAVLDAEHAGLDAALDRAEAALDALPAGAGEAADGIAALARDLDAHLAREEEHLVPVMLRGGGGPPAGGGGPDGGGPDEAVRRWVAEGLEPAVVAALTR